MQNRCDQVVFMKNGTISEFGTYEDLMKSGNDLYSMVSYDQSQKMDKEDTSKDNKNVFTKKDLRKRTVSITSNGNDGETLNNRVEEEKDQLNAGWVVLLKYYKVKFFFLILSDAETLLTLLLRRHTDAMKKFWAFRPLI